MHPVDKRKFLNAAIGNKQVIRVAYLSKQSYGAVRDIYPRNESQPSPSKMYENQS